MSGQTSRGRKARPRTANNVWKFEKDMVRLHWGRGCKAGTNDPFPLSLRIVPMAWAGTRFCPAQGRPTAWCYAPRGISSGMVLKHSLQERASPAGASRASDAEAW